MHRGYVKLHRCVQDSILYDCEPFSRFHAWIDLILLANYKDGAIIVRGNLVKVPRGSVGHSVQTLAEKWKWSRGKVQRFLNQLENEQQIVQQKNNVTTLIEIVNYDKYQSDGQQTEQQTDSRRTADGQQTDTNKKDKKGKKEKKEKKEPLGGDLPDWIPPDEWADYTAMRQQIKKPMTDRAKALAISKLEQLRADGHNPADVLSQSIFNSWQGLFPPKDKPATVQELTPKEDPLEEAYRRAVYG